MVSLLRDFFQSTSRFLLLPRDSSPLHLYRLFRLSTGSRILHLFYNKYFANALQKFFAFSYFYLWYINNLSFVILIRHHLWYASTIVILCNYLLYLFSLLPLCNCIVTLICYNCNSFYEKCQILSKLLYSFSYFV